MKRVGWFMVLLLALVSLAAAAEKPKDFGGNDPNAITPVVIVNFYDDAGRSCMTWMPMSGYYYWFDFVGNWPIMSYMDYAYRDGVFYMGDEALAYVLPGFVGHVIFDAATDRANGFVRFMPYGIRTFLYDLDTIDSHCITRGEERTGLPAELPTEPGIYTLNGFNQSIPAPVPGLE